MTDKTEKTEAAAADTAAAKPADNPNLFATIELNEPLKRGGGDTIGFVGLRKFKAGELRGISMIDLIRCDAETLITLLPRITEPRLEQNELRDLPPTDLFMISTEIANFLLPKGMRQDSPAQ